MPLSIRSSRYRPLEEQRKYSTPRRAISAETDLPAPASGPRSAAAISTSAGGEKQSHHHGGRRFPMTGQPYRELDLQRAQPDLRDGRFHRKKRRCPRRARCRSRALAKAASGGRSATGNSSVNVGHRQEDRRLMTPYPRRGLTNKIGACARSKSIDLDCLCDQPGLDRSAPARGSWGGEQRI